MSESKSLNSKRIDKVKPFKEDDKSSFFQDLLDKINAVIYVSDMDTYELLYLNAQGREQFGDSVGKKCYLALQGDARNPCSFCNNHLLKGANSSGASPIIRTFRNTKNGHIYRCIDSTLKWTDGRFVRFEIATDITEQKNTEKKLERKDKTLEGTALALSRLYSTEDYINSVLLFLRTLGESVDVDRVYIFKNHQDEKTKELFLSQLYEWSKDTVEPQIENPDLQNLPYSLYHSRLLTLLQNNLPYNHIVRQLPDSERWILENQNILSILILPIYTENKLWGFIGFDDCTEERVWSDSEMSILRIAANGFGAHYLENKSKIMIRESNEALLRTNALLEAILESTANTGIFSVSSDMLITMQNTVFGRIMEKITGRIPVVGSSYLELYNDPIFRALEKKKY